MSTIRFHPLDRSADVHEEETILDAARRIDVPLGSSCGGIGICRRCRVSVLEGAENLSEPTRMERDQAKLEGFAPDERLGCQSIVRGDCIVTTSYWGDRQERGARG